MRHSVLIAMNGMELRARPCKCGSTLTSSANISIRAGQASIKDPRCGNCGLPIETYSCLKGSPNPPQTES